MISINSRTNSAVQVSSLPKDKILDLTKLKAFADDKIYVTQMFVFDGVENIIGKGENAAHQQGLSGKGLTLSSI